MSAEGEARPTIVHISGKSTKLATEEDEAKFLSTITKGDTVAMALGGSGDYLAFSASRIADSVGATVLRVPPFVLAKERTERAFAKNKEDDAALLAIMAKEVPNLFYPVLDRDRDIILLRECFRARIDAMKARMACEQRIRQRVIGQIFCRTDGIFPEGGIEKTYDAAKANDAILQAVLKEEAKRDNDLKKACESSYVYQQVFGPIAGMGPALAGRIIASIVDIRRFEKESSFLKYCGVHVLADGAFARRRNGQIANWSGECRQALYLFVTQQAQRRPGTQWGDYLRKMKENLRERHPEPVEVAGVKKYTPIHIQKMASWRTATRLAEHIFREWWKCEREMEEVRQVA